MQLRYGLLAELEAAPGEGDTLAAFLAESRQAVAQEDGTVTWYAFKAGGAVYGISGTVATKRPGARVSAARSRWPSAPWRRGCSRQSRKSGRSTSSQPSNGHGCSPRTPARPCGLRRTAGADSACRGTCPSPAVTGPKAAALPGRAAAQRDGRNYLMAGRERRACHGTTRPVSIQVIRTGAPHRLAVHGHRPPRPYPCPWPAACTRSWAASQNPTAASSAAALTVSSTRRIVASSGGSNRPASGSHRTPSAARTCGGASAIHSPTAANDLARPARPPRPPAGTYVRLWRRPRGSRGSGTRARYSARPGDWPHSRARSPAGRTESCSRAALIGDDDKAGTAFRNDHEESTPT